ncbi:NACHT domain-containing protein [Acidobacteriota bacterium]
MVGIFHRRFGTPTGKAKSGTFEEVMRAYDLWKGNKKPHIMLYFKKVEITSGADLKDEQLQKVMDFKDEIDKNKAFWYRNFTDDAQFKKMVTKHMKSWITNKRSVKKSPEDKTEVLTPEEKKQLKRFEPYKQFALNEHRHLPMKGFETNIRAPIEIEQVYVTMRAHIQFREIDPVKKGKHEMMERHEGEHLSDLDIKGTFMAARKHKLKDIVILGDPGSGKTTLLKYILVMLIEGRGEEKLGLDTNPVPFFAPLRELKDPDKEDFFDFMCKVCKQQQFKISRKDFENLLQAGRGIVLLDGLDEVADEKTRIKTCKWIDDARKVLVNTPFIITSRFAGYLGKNQLKNTVLQLSIRDFSPAEVKAFLLRWFETVEVALHPGDANEEIWRERGREQALELVKNINASAHVRKLAVNPLMLQIIALIRFDRGTKLPERRVELYNECVNVLLEK